MLYVLWRRDNSDRSEVDTKDIRQDHGDRLVVNYIRRGQLGCRDQCHRADLISATNMDRRRPKQGCHTPKEESKTCRKRKSFARPSAQASHTENEGHLVQCRCMVDLLPAFHFITWTAYFAVLSRKYQGCISQDKYNTVCKPRWEILGNIMNVLVVCVMLDIFDLFFIEQNI